MNLIIDFGTIWDIIVKNNLSKTLKNQICCFSCKNLAQLHWWWVEQEALCALQNTGQKQFEIKQVCSYICFGGRVIAKQ